MNSGLTDFIKAYAKDNNITEVEAAMYAGALSSKVLEDTIQYKNFVLTLSMVAPGLLQLVSVLERK